MFFVLFYDIKWENFKCVINMKKYRFIYKFKFFGIFIDMTQLNKICSTHFDNICTASVLHVDRYRSCLNSGYIPTQFI